ncbi:hypothetical protein [Aeromonas rivipollensis]|uniref:hypothetical protein n=1 Tax=Aeromonas rivipollensis TaxID=948519 RepID=UPI003D1B51DA
MKNADMPAMPQSATSEGNVCNYYDYSGPGIPTGLTKREMMAMHIMCGVTSDPARFTPEYGAEQAVLYADALLAELEKGKAS